MSAPYVDRLLTKLTSDSFQSDFNKAQLGNMNTFNNWGEFGTFLGLKAYNKLTVPKNVAPKEEEESDIFRYKKNPLSAKETMDLLLPAKFSSKRSRGILPVKSGEDTQNYQNPLALEAYKYGLPQRHVEANQPSPRPKKWRKPKYVDVNERNRQTPRKKKPLKKNYVYRVNV